MHLDLLITELSKSSQRTLAPHLPSQKATCAGWLFKFAALFGFLKRTPIQGTPAINYKTTPKCQTETEAHWSPHSHSTLTSGHSLTEQNSHHFTSPPILVLPKHSPDKPAVQHAQEFTDLSYFGLGEMGKVYLKAPPPLKQTGQSHQLPSKQVSWQSEGAHSNSQSCSQIT